MRRAGGYFGPALAAVAALIASPAAAHTGIGIGGGLGAGFAHPFVGLDHLLAMASVGALGAVAGGRALWALPATFMAVMSLGGALALAGVPLPGVETGIAASLVVFGVLLASRIGLPTIAAMAVVAVFALFHGHAHGAELPALASPATYVLGFVAASGLLHLLGIGVARGLGRLPAWSAPSLRLAGGGVAAAGLALLIG
ncbi:MAG: HupE/UreJ family protein [Alphaproteobacteria bacterium]|nr:HupE/UreJ family protein [Alphaproteobacteria bacterium]